jgi:hypothetical protein
MPRTLTKVRVFNPGGLRRNLKRDKKRLGMKVSEFGNYVRKSAQTKYKILAHHNRTNKRVSAARASNPPKRKLSLAQKLHFGTKRQRAAAGLMLSKAGKRKRVRTVNSGGLRRTLTQFQYADKTYRSNARIPWAKTKYKMAASKKRKDSRIGNPGEIITLANGRARIASTFINQKVGNRKIRKAEKRGDLAGMVYRKKRQLSRLYKDHSRIGNPGEIITLAGLAGNPGRLRKRKVGNIMAKRRRKSVSGVRRRVRRTRRANPNVMVRYSRRRRNTGRVRSMRRRTHRRSNPGFLSGGVGMLVGIFGGAALTGAIAARIPGQLSSGIAGYLTTGVVAYAQGTLAGKLLKNPTLGKNMVTGGLIYLGLKIAGDLIPGLSLPFGLSGLGAIGSSNFSYPQIPASNTMLYASPTPVMAAAKGMGRIARMGRGY